MDEETFVAAARYDVAQVDPELVDDYDAPRRTGTTSAASSATGASGARRPREGR